MHSELSFTELLLFIDEYCRIMLMQIEQQNQIINLLTQIVKPAGLSEQSSLTHQFQTIQQSPRLTEKCQLSGHNQLSRLNQEFETTVQFEPTGLNQQRSQPSRLNKQSDPTGLIEQSQLIKFNQQYEPTNYLP